MRRHLSGDTETSLNLDQKIEELLVITLNNVERA